VSKLKQVSESQNSQISDNIQVAKEKNAAI